MSSVEKCKIVFSVAASVGYSNCYNRRAAFGVVARIGNIVIEAQHRLCNLCDAGQQSEHRAELRASCWAMMFVHEVAKLGCKMGGERCGVVHHIDSRSVIADWMTVVLKSESTFIVKGIWDENRRVKHWCVWESLIETKRCLDSFGMTMKTERVDVSEGDGDCERAEELADEAWVLQRNGGGTARCVKCNIRLGGAREAAFHFKNVHMGRDLDWENRVFDEKAADCHGCFEKVLCSDLSQLGSLEVENV